MTTVNDLLKSKERVFSNIVQIDTSAAARQANKGRAPIQREVVLRALRLAGLQGLTDEEGYELYGMNPSTWRPRRKELERSGLVYASTETRPTRAGRASRVWKAKPVNYEAA